MDQLVVQKLKLSSPSFLCRKKRSKRHLLRLMYLDLSIVIVRLPQKLRNNSPVGLIISSNTSRTLGRLTLTTSSQDKSEPLEHRCIGKTDELIEGFGESSSQLRPNTIQRYSIWTDHREFWLRTKFLVIRSITAFCAHSFLWFCFLAIQEMNLPC